MVKPGEWAFVKMPDDPPGKCRRLKKCLYGMRPAASAWEDDFSDKLRSIGFRSGKSSAVVFWNPELEIRCVVHRDDFTVLGFEEDL